MKNDYKGIAEYKKIIKDNKHLIDQCSKHEMPVSNNSLKELADALAMTTIILQLAVKTMMSIVAAEQES